MNFEPTGTALPYIDIDYFGRQLSVPQDTVAVATDADGAVYAFYDEWPRILQLGENFFWGNGLGTATRIAHFNYVGDWRESLYIMEAQ